MPQPARFEHIALNVQDPAAVADWYCGHLNMKVTLSGPAPVSVRFVSDEAGHMMFEFYHNAKEPLLDCTAIAPLSLHIAFAVDDVRAVADELVAAGATVERDVWTTGGGDTFAILRDPWGIPLQFVRRERPLI